MNNVVVFIAGAVVGATAAYLYLKQKYSKQLDSEISIFSDEMDKLRAILKKTKDEKKSEVNEEQKAEDIMADYAATTNANAPYTISDDEYSNENGYETERLTMFKNNVLMRNTNGEVIEDIDGLLGMANLSKKGEYDEDMLYVRNPETGFDYAIQFIDEEYDNEEDTT